MRVNERAYNKVTSKLSLLNINKDVLTDELQRALDDGDDMFIEFAEANLHNCVNELKIYEYLLKLIKNERTNIQQ